MRTLSALALDIAAAFTPLPQELRAIVHSLGHLRGLDDKLFISVRGASTLVGGTGRELLTKLFVELPAPTTPAQYAIHDEILELMS